MWDGLRQTVRVFSVLFVVEYVFVWLVIDVFDVDWFVGVIVDLVGFVIWVLVVVVLY